jgi:hypothetical protein
MHDYLTPLQIGRQRHEELLAEVENIRLAKEIRHGRKEAGREWRISLGGWILRLQRSAEYEARPALKS